MILWGQHAGAAYGQEWVLVDGIVATIENVPILRSDVQMESDFGLLKGASDGARFDSLLTSYINRLLIRNELEDIGGFRLNEGEAAGAYQEYLAGYENRAEFEEKLDKWGIEEKEIFRRMERALLVSKYTESRMKFFVKVIPSDIEKAYEQNPGKWGNEGVLAAWEAIKAQLAEQAFNQEMGRWLAALRQRYDLVIIEPVGKGVQ